MWNDLSRSSLGRRFLRKYVVLIIIPLAVASVFLIFLIGYVESRVALYQQESYLKSIRKVWDTPMSQARSVQDALSSNAELGWCLRENYYSRSEQLYLYKKSLFTFFNNIIAVNDEVDSIQIYSDNPDILRAWPFHTKEEIPLEGEWMEKLHLLKGNDMLWYIRPAESNEKEPDFYAYCRLYSTNFMDALGYVEIHINGDFLREYVGLLGKNMYQEANLYLYAGNELIYRETSFLVQDDVLENKKLKDKESGSFGKHYFFRFEEQMYGIQLLILIPNSRVLSEYVALILFCCFLVGCLYILSLLFFMDISRLSRRIGNFSRYMQEMDGQEIEAYQENKDYLQKQLTDRRDEFSILVDSFNSLADRNDVLSKKVLNLELFNKDAKLAAMQAQIHPHFIYGTLETIRMLAIQNNDEEVENIVCAFSKLMRYSLNNPSEKSTLSKELEINRYYMDIQLLRYDERLIFHTDVTEEMPDIYCPPFIIQPLLENALVHGVSASLLECEVCLRVYGEHGDYVIRVEDNGNAVTKERISQVNTALASHTAASALQGEQSGFALQNVSERLNLFYQGRATLSLYKPDHWTISEIRIKGEEWRKQICSDC